MAFAYAMHLAKQTPTRKTPVMVACTAINFALHLNELPEIMNKMPAKILKESIRRRLGGPPRKMTEMRPQELRKRYLSPPP